MKTFNILEAINYINKNMAIDLDLVEKIEYTNSLENTYIFTLYFFNSSFVYIVNLDENTYFKQNI